MDSAMNSSTVRVDLNARGVWTIELPEGREPIACETFDDAQRVGYLCASRRQPCELVVHDAYHRVIYRRLLSSDPVISSPTRSPDAGDQTKP